MRFITPPKNTQREKRRAMFENSQGQEFEQLIEWANMQYYERGQGVIQKIPTPFKIERAYNHSTKKNEVVSAYPEKKSTVDFGGTAQGKSIWFDAKTTKNRASFPLANIKDHQIEYLRQVDLNGGKAFLLIYSQVKNKTWLLWIQDLLLFIEKGERKSLLFEWLEYNCPVIGSKDGIVLDYLNEALK